jgi:hypothetical protein
MAGGGVERDVPVEIGLVAAVIVSVSDPERNMSRDVEVSDTGVTRVGWGRYDMFSEFKVCSEMTGSVEGHGDSCCKVDEQA